MAGSIAVTTTPLVIGGVVGGITKYGIVWTSDGAGAVSGNPATITPGTIVLVEFVPGSGGVQPTDLYDVTMTDDLGINILDDGAGASLGANLSNVTATSKIPHVIGAAGSFVRRWLHGGAYTPVVAAAGAAKQGTINVYVAAGVL